MSKLYTEEQVKYAIKKAQKCDHDCGGVYFYYTETDIIDIIDEQTPIELPSDEEIKEEVSKMKFSKDGYRGGVIEGMQWMRDKIKGGKGE